ncbi:unnamed protein product [Adineta steineri]|uniref:Polycystin cation channel PKD1/PKD2 domain-containing protein n=1 Tax=Adineta steineri TaxID=433720 RepID=A0A815I761_9BILA|nr:unnamed protein product [Adineta steineri]CAF3860207.1 unnamed protein product [Adineta steineri]
MASLTLFQLLFVDEILSYSTLLHTAQTLFEMMLMKFDAYELTDAAPLLEPICFSLFFLFIVFICMSMFITIISDSFRIVRNNTKVNCNEDQTIFKFMLHKFQRWIGLGKLHDVESFEQNYEQLHGKYSDPIEHFPKKIDQLLNALN